MFLAECCKVKTSEGRALPGSVDVDIIYAFMILDFMVYVQDFMLHLKCAARFRCSVMSLHIWAFVV